jgi:hypothetical protein
MEPNQNRDPWEQQGTESVTGRSGVPDWTILSPFGVAVFGAGKQPVERLLALQGALANGIDLVAFDPWPAISAAGRTGLAALGALARWCLQWSGIKTLPGDG